MSPNKYNIVIVYVPHAVRSIAVPHLFCSCKFLPLYLSHLFDLLLSSISQCPSPLTISLLFSVSVTLFLFYLS